MKKIPLSDALLLRLLRIGQPEEKAAEAPPTHLAASYLTLLDEPRFDAYLEPVYRLPPEGEILVVQPSLCEPEPEQRHRYERILLVHIVIQDMEPAISALPPLQRHLRPKGFSLRESNEREKVRAKNWRARIWHGIKK